MTCATHPAPQGRPLHPANPAVTPTFDRIQGHLHASVSAKLAALGRQRGEALEADALADIVGGYVDWEFDLAANRYDFQVVIAAPDAEIFRRLALAGLSVAATTGEFPLPMGGHLCTRYALAGLTVPVMSYHVPEVAQ